MYSHQQNTIPLTPLYPAIVTTPLTDLQPSTPIEPEPTLPIFIGENITTHTQQPYSGTITSGGVAYLRYNQDAEYFNDFELPEWKVEYKYEPMIEVLITDGSETLCARYSWKKEGFGYARPVCLWSDVRAAVPLEDTKAVVCGFRVIESHVWVNGVGGLWLSKTRLCGGKTPHCLLKFWLPF